MLVNKFIMKNSYRFFNVSLIVVASVFTYQVATSHILVNNSLNWAVIAVGISLYIGSYLRLVNSINEVQLKYFIIGSMTLLMVVEFHGIQMPVAYLFMVYLVIYNSSFTINYILYKRYFNLIFLFLQILVLFLVGLVIFHNTFSRITRLYSGYEKNHGEGYCK